MNMNSCTSHRRQIALLSLDALTETEKAAVSEHMKECPSCRAYAAQVHGIAGLLAQDAQRTVPPIGSLPRIEPRRNRWFEGRSVPRLATAGLALIVVGAAALFFRPESTREIARLEPAVAPAAAVIAPVPSIANLRHLIEKDLEELIEIDNSRGAGRVDLVFSADMRRETP